MENMLAYEQIEALRALDTCTVSNAIETFDLRLRNEGFADASIRCLTPRCDVRMVGYATTARIRSSGPPPAGHTYYDNTDWWNHLLSMPEPRILVLEDIGDIPGFGSFIGGVHANILRALGCEGVVTNGSIRDLETIEALNLPVFADHVAVSHAYVHLVEFGCPVQVGGLKVAPGDLLHGDRHGVLSIPKQIAAGIPEIAREIVSRERNVIDLCKSPDFSVAKLREAVKHLG